MNLDSQSDRKPQAHAAPLQSLRVLVVAWHEDSRLLLSTCLSLEGAVVIAAGTPAQAISALDRGPFDLIVSHLGPSRREALELIRQVRSRPAKRGGAIPAIAVAAGVSSADYVEVLSAGFQDLLLEPLEGADLVAVVALLSGRTPPDCSAASA